MTTSTAKKTKYSLLLYFVLIISIHLFAALAQSQQDDRYQNYFLSMWDGNLPKIPSTSRVVVVGAGAAGLSASLVLKSAGINVILLEKDVNVGGRMWTNTQKFTNMLYSEDGSMRIPGSHYLTRKVITDCQVQVSNFNMTVRGMSLNGNFYNLPQQANEYYEQAAKIFNLTGPNKPSPTNTATDMLVNSDCFKYVKRACAMTGWESIISHYDHLSFRQFLSLECGWKPNMISYYAYETAYEPYMEFAFLEAFRDIVGQWWGNNLVQVNSGSRGLAQSMWTGFSSDGTSGCIDKPSLQQDTIFGAHVYQIQQNINLSLTVSYINNNGVSENILADYVINTCPFPVVNHQTFLTVNNSPALDYSLREAIRRISYTDAAKVFIQFRDKAWFQRQGISGGMYVTDTVSQTMYFGDHVPIDQFRIVYLVGYDWVRAADDIAVDDIQSNIRTAVKDLARTQPQNPNFENSLNERLESSHVHVWINAFNQALPCEYSLYFNNMLKSSMNGRLFFAGEHISWSHAWIQGALESGIVAANRVWCAITNDNSTLCDMSKIPFTPVSPDVWPSSNC